MARRPPRPVTIDHPANRLTTPVEIFDHPTHAATSNLFTCRPKKIGGVRFSDISDYTGPFNLLHYMLEIRDPGDLRAFYDGWSQQ